MAAMPTPRETNIPNHAHHATPWHKYTEAILPHLVELLVEVLIICN
jgi:hypothetical protein